VDGNAIKISTETTAMRMACFGVMPVSYVSQTVGSHPTDAMILHSYASQNQKRPVHYLQAAFTFAKCILFRRRRLCQLPSEKLEAEREILQKSSLADPLEISFETFLPCPSASLVFEGVAF
jgi:hypothetical protein